jgi:hypothetical protein
VGEETLGRGLLMVIGVRGGAECGIGEKAILLDSDRGMREGTGEAKAFNS